MRQLLSKVKQNDPDAGHLSESSLRMILDFNHCIRRLANDAAHNASDAEKKFAVDSDADLTRAIRIDLGQVYDYRFCNAPRHPRRLTRHLFTRHSFQPVPMRSFSF
jgi:hypothetical protein